MATYVVRTHYDHALDDERLAARPAHREWLTHLRDTGRLVNAGPLADDSGALLVFTADSEEALRALLDEDPYPSNTLSYDVVGEWKHLFPLA